MIDSNLPGSENQAPKDNEAVHRRRPRYSGKNPRHFDQKYKEHQQDEVTLAKVLASGKTPAGTHRPIMVAEVLEALAPVPGDFAVDLTMGHGGHTRALLPLLQPGGRLLAVDADPLELAKTEARLRVEGNSEDSLIIRRANFAGIQKVLADLGRGLADIVLADLGASSMQLDDPARGFTFKQDGPLDLRMNFLHGEPAHRWLAKTTPSELVRALVLGADEPNAEALGKALAGGNYPTTFALVTAIKKVAGERDNDLTLRRVFQALRIVVNDEFTALDTLLRVLPQCLSAGGRVAFLTFHSGEDRRVKQAFESGEKQGYYARISSGVIRASAAEIHGNPRASSAKLRWAVRS